ncbi:transposase [Streptomyces sp. enrichment culture]|uniref:transposase n=1 Tax=Streptomyces sp. enrichment culture TaxID=1795815 RepID=UPI003F55A270
MQIVQRRDGGFRSTWVKAGTRPPAVPLFAVVPRRWGVERTFAWPGRCRRLSKDYEYLRGNSESVIYLAPCFSFAASRDQPADRLFRRPLAGHLPLALELVAARCRHAGSTLADAADRLQNAASRLDRSPEDQGRNPTG